MRKRTFTIKRQHGEKGFVALLVGFILLWIVWYGALLTGLVLGCIWLANHI
jgi:hypothetical protein